MSSPVRKKTTISNFGSISAFLCLFFCFIFHSSNLFTYSYLLICNFFMHFNLFYFSMIIYLHLFLPSTFSPLFPLYFPFIYYSLLIILHFAIYHFATVSLNSNPTYSFLLYQFLSTCILSVSFIYLFQLLSLSIYIHFYRFVHFYKFSWFVLLLFVCWWLLATINTLKSIYAFRVLLPL